MTNTNDFEQRLQGLAFLGNSDFLIDQFAIEYERLLVEVRGEPDEKVRQERAKQLALIVARQILFVSNLHGLASEAEGLPVVRLEVSR
jgi:hypothetical protein